MSIRQGSNYIAGGGSQVNVDNLTINKNASNEIQAVSLINQNDPNANIKLWLGSEEDYEAVETKDENTVYFTKEGVIDIPGENSGGLEIGDIGIAPFGIDETQNKRRYLNGQVISQSQFVSFTDKIKAVVQLNPNLTATEENWQAEVTNSVLGQCGKFVIDDEAGTIRLPKVVNINGLQDLALIGSIKAESLPNITGGVSADGAAWQSLGQIDSFYGCIEPTDDQGGYPQTGGRSGDNSDGWTLDASRSSSTYQDNAPVQQEAVQYPYFIQVATGVEESVDVTREIELNNPFFLGMSQYFESEPNNASWLISNGAFHSGATYVSFYEWLLKIYNGTETVDGVNVKSSTDTYDDYDYVINTTDTTFRLPIRTASDYVVKSKEATTEDSSWYRVYKSGWVEQGGTLTTSSTNFQTFNLNKEFISSNYTITGNVYDETQSSYAISFRTKTETTFEGKCTQSNIVFNWQACGQGAERPQSRIYFYVGETIQDANIIAASQVLTTVADCVKKSSAIDRAAVVGWGIPDYSAGIAISSGYEADTNGFVVLLSSGSGNDAMSKISVNGILVSMTTIRAPYVQETSASAFVKKGDVVTIEYNKFTSFTFYPLIGG